jgi:hypothetical protein
VPRSLVVLARFAAVTAAAAAVFAAPASAATRYVSPAGDDARACDAAAPCASLGRAYTVAQPGDAVVVAAGSYPKQRIPRVDGRAGAAVTIAPAAGASVTLDGLNVAGDNVTVRGMRTGFLDLDGEGAPLKGVTIVGGSGPGIWIDTAQGLNIVGGSYGDNQDKPTVQFAPDPPSTDVTFDGVEFHDAVATNSSVHMECIWAGGVQRFTVRNSLFRNCAYFDIFLTTFQGGDPANVLLETNVFEQTYSWDGSEQPYGVNVANWVQHMDGLTMRNNTFATDYIIQSPVVTNTRVTGNVGAFRTCTNGVTYSHNVSSQTKCGPTDRVVSNLLAGFVNPKGHDWHLLPGAPEIDAGDPSDHPATDRDGKARVGPPDAGAQEFGTPPSAGAAPDSRRTRALTAASFSPRTICPTRRGCRRTALARLTLAKAVTVRVTVQRLRGSKRTTVRRITRHAKAGALLVRVRAKGLKPGRYRVVVSAGSTRKSFALRVR